MAEYSTSQKTKKALIMAAGELFAENEINVVGLRDIALKAGENMGSIHYHFGGKKGLLKAVIDYAWEPALNNTLGEYLQSHEILLATREGQALLVAGMIDTHFKTIFNDRPLWCGILISRILDRKMPFSEDIIENNIRFFLEPFFHLYQKISGDDAKGNALYWILSIFPPAQTLRKGMNIIEKLEKNINWKKLRNVVIRGALANLNLMEETEKALKTLD